MGVNRIGTNQTFQTLYKKTSNGAIQAWSIETDGSTIITRWGQEGGAIQETRDVVTEGKNVGKKNATSAAEQANAEALAQWTKKLKKGYVKSPEDATADKVDEIITGGVAPMLAHRFDEHGHKLKYPLYGNPKLDGTRCIAMVVDGECTLWTRSRKPITSMPHIVKVLENAYKGVTVTLDGELYAAALNNDFEQIIHYVRQMNAADGCEKIQYWIYDIAGPGTFAERYARLSTAFPQSAHLVLVEATLLSDEAVAMDYFGSCKQQGFEGSILRNVDGQYVGKRSVDLIKLKSFLDDDFVIVGIEEGRGKLAGHVGAFVCRTATGAKFRAKLKGSTAALKDHFQAPDECLGKLLTVQYQNLTSDGIPRFPVGIAIRDYE